MRFPQRDSQRDNLEARMVEISERVQAIQDAADTASRELQPAELKEITDLHREFEQVSASLSIDSIATASSVGRGRVTDPAKPGTSEPVAIRRHDVVDALVRPELQGRRYGDLFGAPSSMHTEFRSLGEMVRVAQAAPTDHRLQMMNALGMTEGIGAEGGFLVPTQFSMQLLNRSLEQEAVRARATVLPAESNILEVPNWNMDGTDGKRAGLKMVWSSEGGTLTPQKMKLIVGTIKVNKGAILVPLSGELLQDGGPAISQTLETALRNATAIGLDTAFIFGSGSGDPLGVMNAPCLITVTKETSQTAATIVEANILKMAARLAPASWSRAVWFVHPTALVQLLTLAQAAGPFAGGRTAVITEREGTLFLLTRPVVVTEACAPLGTTGDIILGDWEKYLIAMRSELRIQTSIHYGFATDEVGVRLIARFGGQPELDTPIKLRDGSNTVSHFVALETRA